MDSWCCGWYFNQYKSPNIVIVPTDHPITMSQHNYIRSSATDPRLLSDQIQTNNPTLLPQTQANLKKHLTIPPPTTMVIDKSIELKQSFSNSNGQVRSNLITLTDSNKKDSNTKIKDTEDLSKISSRETEKNNSNNYSKQNYNDSNKSDAQKCEKHQINEGCKFKHTSSPSDLKKQTAASENFKISQQEYASSDIGPNHDKFSNTSNQKQSAGALNHFLNYQNELRTLKNNTAPKVKDTESVSSDKNKSLDTNKISNQYEDNKKKKESTSNLDKSVVSVKRIDESIELQQSFSNSNRQVRNNLTTLTDSNKKDSNTNIKDTEDHSKISSRESEKNNSNNCSKQNYNDSNKSDAQKCEKRQINEECKLKHTSSPSDLKKQTAASENFKISQQEYASSNIGLKYDKLSNTSNQKQSAGALKHFLNYQNELRTLKNNTAPKVKDTESVSTDKNKSLDTNKIPNQYEDNKKKKESTSNLDKSVVSIKRGVNHVDQTIENEKSNKRSKNNANESRTANSNRKSNEKTSPSTEFNENKNRTKKSSYKTMKNTLNESKETKALSLEKEKRKRKSKEERAVLELKKRKEDYREARSRSIESKKKRQISEKFAPFLELRKKKEKRKKKKTEEESKKKHCDELELKKTNLKSKEHSSYIQQQENNQQADLTKQNFIRKEDGFSRDTSFNFEDTKKSIKEYKKNVIAHKQLTKEMKAHTSPTLSPTEMKRKKASPIKEKHLKSQGYYKSEKLKTDSMIINTTKIENERNAKSLIRKEDVSKYNPSNKIKDNMDLRTLLIRKRAKDNAAKLKRLCTKTPEQDNFLITLQQDVTANSKPAMMTHISGKTKGKKNKKVKLLISILCDSDDSDDSGETETKYSSSPFEDLSFLDDINVDEIVDSLEQNRIVSNENQSSVQRIQNLLKKDAEKSLSHDKIERKSRLLNIELNNCDTSEILHSSDNDECIFESRQFEQTNTDSKKAIINIASNKLIDDDVFEVIDITDDMDNDPIVIEHNVEELIEELFASPTKENFNGKSNSEEIGKRTAITFGDDSKQYIQTGKKLDSKPDPDAILKQNTTTASESNLRLDESQKIEKNLKSQYNEDYKQPETKLAPEILLSSEEPQNELIYANQILDVVMSDVAQYFPNTKNYFIERQDDTESENVNKVKLVTGLAGDELAVNSKFVKKHLDDQNSNSAKKNKTHHLSGSNQPETKKSNNHVENARELNIENVEYQSGCMKNFNEDVSLHKCAINRLEDNLSEVNDTNKSNYNVENATEINNKNVECQRHSKENAYEGVLSLKDAPEQSKDNNISEINDALAACIKNILDKKICITGVIKRGFFSKAYRCKDDKGKLYALKILRFPEKGRYLSEIYSLLNKSTTEDNCYNLQMICAMEISGRYCFLSDYYPKTLRNALKRRDKGFHINLVQQLAKQLISAVSVLTVNNIIHTDIMPKHILLNNSNDKIKLCGFDSAAYSHDINIPPNRGIPPCRAPETILGFYPSFGIDVWATALVIFEMATKSRLITGRYNQIVLYNQIRTLRPFDYKILEECQFGHLYFKGTEFLPFSEKNQVLLPSCTDNNLLAMKLFESYDKQWRPNRKDFQVTREMKKMEMLSKLLQQMLEINPRERVPITHALSDEFFQKIP